MREYRDGRWGQEIVRKNPRLADDIVDAVGGLGNIKTARHCATRLRLELRDEDKAATDKVKGLKGVLAVVQAGGQYQVVIGNDVPFVHARIAELIGAGRAYARFDGDTVMFKAEIGSLSRSVALIQGVWVHPQLRGRGLAAPAMAAVVRSIRADLRRTPSLYVNDFNIPARRTYERVGFRQIGTFASVLF